MKKIYLLGSLTLLLGVTACNDKENYYEATYHVPTLNILTSTSDGVGVASECTYDYYAKTSGGKNTGNVTAKSIQIEGSSYNLKTSDGSFVTNGFTVSFSNLAGTLSGNKTYPVSDGKFSFTNYINTPKLLGLNVNVDLPEQFAICQYNIGEDYFMNTFPANAFYSGVTTTTYPGANGQESNTTKTIPYQLKLNIGDNTATMYMYNAKFSGVAAEPPKSQINLEGLTVEYLNGVVTVKGENIVPVVVEGTVSTPYENFIFNNIEFKTTTPDMSECEINYTVAGRFTGNFQGSYLFGNKYVQ